MKIIFKKDMICAMTSPLVSGISTKVTIAAAEGILFQATKPSTCVMTTYDLEKGVQVTMMDGLEVIEDGSAIISASKFMQIIRAMEGGDITLTVDDRMTTTITCGRSSHTMIALPASDFPEIPRLYSQNGFVVSQPVLKNMMGKCLFAMGSNDQRPVLNGLFISISEDRLDTVSCDSFKMAVCSTETTLENINQSGEALKAKLIVPNKSVNELYKLLDEKNSESKATIYMSKKNIIVMLGGIIFFSKLIDGEYVDYNRIIIRDHKVTVYVDRDCLLGALERAALITEEKVAGAVRSHVKLQLEGNILKITANSGAGSSYDELFIRHEGNDMVIAFNNRYLIDCLRSCKTDTVKLSLTSAMTSVNIEAATPKTDDSCSCSGSGNVTENDLFFLLPVRMKE